MKREISWKNMRERKNAVWIARNNPKDSTKSVCTMSKGINRGTLTRTNK